jgi:hypothetical protein
VRFLDVFSRRKFSKINPVMSTSLQALPDAAVKAPLLLAPAFLRLCFAMDDRTSPKAQQRARLRIDPRTHRHKV